MDLSVSLQNFCDWKHPFTFESQLKFVDKLSAFNLDGFEFHLSEEDIVQEKLLSFKNPLNKIITVHLPKKFSEKIFDYLPALVRWGVKYFIIHADLYSPSFFTKLPILIENSDKNKLVGKKIEEILPTGRNICFDINHAIENFGADRAKEQYFLAKDKIKELHVSANKPLDMYGFISCSHWSFSNSKEVVPEYLSSEGLWVLEGAIPNDKMELFKLEIDIVRGINK